MLVVSSLLNMIAKAKTFTSDKQAVTAIEYALIAALIAVVIIGAVATIGTDIGSTFNTISTAI